MSTRSGGLTNKTFASLRIRNYRIYFMSQVVSFSGNWMQSLALGWFVIERTGSGTALGTVMAARFLPTLFLAPFGGVFADRFEKRLLIAATQATAALLALGLAIVTLTGVVELWMVYLLSAGFGAVTAVDNPSRQTFVTEMVGPEHVSNAVTLNSVVVNAARVVGPAIGGVLIATVGIGQAFAVNSATHVVVVVVMFLIRPDELHPSVRSKSAKGQLREGFRYAWSEPSLRTTLIMLAAIGTFTYEFQTTLPMLAEFTFGAGATGLAIMTSLMGAGAVTGGLVIASADRPTPKMLVAVAMGFGLSVTLLAVAPTVEVAYAAMPFVGAMSIATVSLSNASLQLSADPEFRGRIMSLFAVAMLGSTPIGSLIVGWLGENISPRFALLVGGIAAMGAAGFGWSRLDHREPAAPSVSTTATDT